MGSQSEHRTNRACAGTYLTDTFSHSVLQELSLIAEIPQLYSQERLSLAQIAEQCWVSRVYVRKVLREAGVSLDGKPPPQALTGQTPFGWKKEKGKLAPHLAEQKTIETMIRLRKAGQSLHSIARELTTGGVRTKNGGKWHAKSVSQILESNSRLMDQYKNRDSNIRKEK